MICYDVDTALAEVPVNIVPLTDATDFKTIEDAVAYNAGGMALYWHFTTCAGAYTATAVTPTTSGTTVPLANTVLGREIHSLEDIFDLVKSEFVCVSNEESKTEFWWNPKKVFELIDQKEQGLLNSCIQAYGPNVPSGPMKP